MRHGIFASLALAALLSGCAGGKMYMVDKKDGMEPKMSMASEAMHDHDHDHLATAGEEWTCPHEGGTFPAPGKCPNKWCGLDLVKKKKN